MRNISDNTGATVTSKFGGGLYFGEHGAGLEVAVFTETEDFGGGNMREGFLGFGG